MAKKTVDNSEFMEMLLTELKSLRAELDSLKKATDSPAETSKPKRKSKKTVDNIKQLEKELLELDAEYWTIMEKRAIIAGRLADLYTESGEKRESSYYDFSTSRQVFAVAKLAKKVEIPLLNMLYKGQLSQVIDLSKREGDDAARKKLTEFLDELQAR